MKKNYFLYLLLPLLIAFNAKAQKTDAKSFPAGTVAGYIMLYNSYGELLNGKSDKVFKVGMPIGYTYKFSALVNMLAGAKYEVKIDGATWGYLQAGTNGWQILGSNFPAITVGAGSHEVRIKGTNGLVPMVEEISIVPQAASSGKTPTEDKWEYFIERMNQTITRGNIAGKVLPNPEGEYSHAIDTAFGYSHFSWIYLNPGNHIFKTTGSTISRSLVIFNPANFTESWSNVNGGLNGESYVSVSASTGAYFVVMLRAVTNGQIGTTNITYNGDPLINNATIGGKSYSMPTLRGGPMNFFTCKITGDTRIFVSRFSTSSVRGYNDDYSGGGGNWNWGLASRIKKTFTGSDSVQYTFVCSYSPSSTGIADIYMGCGNSNLHDLEPQNFPSLTNDDAIRSAPQNGYYNCISWSGGITTTWIWPPSLLSTYNCTNANLLQCFDNFYSNNPVRYPGAWNYTRTGATVSNSVVDLWRRAAAGSYQHASVKKPGNNHPHGYDWESKPGSTNRTFHPRYALEQANWYGAVTDYYRHTGTFARMGELENAITSDVDAIKAGLAIIDKATLTVKANEKLSGFMQKINTSLTGRFEELYKIWDATKTANASMSDPSMYCQNKEYKDLESFTRANRYSAMLMVFDKFTKGDHLIGDLLLTLTTEKYGKLLDEVKTERLANLYDNAGRYRIHGDHDNGVLYIEKILKSLEEEVIITPAEDIVVSVSPNPVKEILTVQVVTVKDSRISVRITSSQTLVSRILQQEKEFSAGSHRFTASVQGIAGNSGDMLAVQVTVNGVVKTVKVLVAK